MASFTPINIEALQHISDNDQDHQGPDESSPVTRSTATTKRPAPANFDGPRISSETMARFVPTRDWMGAGQRSQVPNRNKPTPSVRRRRPNPCPPQVAGANRASVQQVSSANTTARVNASASDDRQQPRQTAQAPVGQLDLDGWTPGTAETSILQSGATQTAGSITAASGGRSILSMSPETAFASLHSPGTVDTARGSAVAQRASLSRPPCNSAHQAIEQPHQTRRPSRPDSIVQATSITQAPASTPTPSAQPLPTRSPSTRRPWISAASDEPIDWNIFSTASGQGQTRPLTAPSGQGRSSAGSPVNQFPPPSPRLQQNIMQAQSTHPLIPTSLQEFAQPVLPSNASPHISMVRGPSHGAPRSNSGAGVASRSSMDGTAVGRPQNIITNVPPMPMQYQARSSGVQSPMSLSSGQRIPVQASGPYHPAFQQQGQRMTVQSSGLCPLPAQQGQRPNNQSQQQLQPQHQHQHQQQQQQQHMQYLLQQRQAGMTPQQAQADYRSPQFMRYQQEFTQHLQQDQLQQAQWAAQDPHVNEDALRRLQSYVQSGPTRAHPHAQTQQPNPHQHGRLPATSQADFLPPGTKTLIIGNQTLQSTDDPRVSQWLQQTVFQGPTFAPANYKIGPQHPHWSNAIHTAHLDEPTIKPPQNATMYAWIDQMLLAPLIIYTKFGNAEAKLYVKPQVYQKLARSHETPTLTHERPVVVGSYTLRVTCRKIQPHWKITKDTKLSVADYLALDPGLEWPDYLIALNLNRKKAGAPTDNDPHFHALEWRKKTPHIKSMPIDITEKVIKDYNICDIVLSSPSPNQPAKSEYILGFESVYYGDEAKVRSQIQDVSMESTPARIKRSLGGNASADDDSDELQIMTTHLTIHVRDPLAGTLVDEPVQSELCKHFECFDLKAFLLSRTMDKPEGWRCPICSVDARPKRLKRDPWMKSVIGECGEDVDAIEVDADAKWKVKEDKEKEDKNGNRDRQRSRTHEAAAKPVEKRQIEIIDLDDD